MTFPRAHNRIGIWTHLCLTPSPLASHYFMIPLDRKTLCLLLITKPFKIIISVVFITSLWGWQVRYHFHSTFHEVRPGRETGHRPPGPGLVRRGVGTPMRNLCLFIQGFPQHTDLGVVLSMDLSSKESKIKAHSSELRNTIGSKS